MSEYVRQAAYKALSKRLELRTGQVLNANRHWRVDMALGPIMRAHKIPDIINLAVILDSGLRPDLDNIVIEAMINNETSFFRDPINFAMLTGSALDTAAKSKMAEKKLRIWASACSTGQEAYSCAMAIQENSAKWQDWKIEIIATDVASEAIEKAKIGRYTQFEIQRGLPVTMMLKYFTQQDGDWIAKDFIREKIQFSNHNLLEESDFLGQFDIILCRNMLMYLCENKRSEVLSNIAQRLSPHGFLMLGAAETVLGQSDVLHTAPDFRGFYQHSVRASIADMRA